MFFLKLIFRDEAYFTSLFYGHLHANCLFYILTIYRKCLPFQFLRCGIRIHTPILTEVQRGHISGKKSGHKLLKNVLFKFNFQHEGHLYAK